MNDPSGFSALCIAERISEASNRRENAKGLAKVFQVVMDGTADSKGSVAAD